MDTAPVHGDRARYYRGCRCPECTKANTVYQRGYRAGLTGPELATFVDRRRTTRTARTATGRTVTWIEPELPL